MKNEKITIENYQQHAMKTCLPSAKNTDYCDWGYRAEQAEMKAKIYGFHAKQIRDGADFDKQKHIDRISDEIGDVFWFIALMCELSTVSFSTCFYNAKYNHADGRYERICISDLLEICKDFKIDPVKCLQRNIDKLASRAERGVIKGSGDNR